MAKVNIGVIGLPLFQNIRGIHNQILVNQIERLGWKVSLASEATPAAFDALRIMACDAAVVRITSPEMNMKVKNLGIPVVNISGWLENPMVPTVVPNAWEQGVLAVEHLNDRGHTRLGCVVTSTTWLSKQTIQAIRHTAAIHSASLDVFELCVEKSEAESKNPFSNADLARFEKWIKTRSIPFGMILVDGRKADVLMESCRRIGLSIPKDVSIISTTFHKEHALTCNPSLTCIVHDDLRMMETAVKMLKSLLSGKKPVINKVLISPLKIRQGCSSAFVAVNNPHVYKALEFIHENLHRQITANDISEYVNLTKNILGQYFKRETGLTIYQYIVKQRIRKAGELLSFGCNMTLNDIAKHCGFRDRKDMNRVFRRITGEIASKSREPLIECSQIGPL